jgi:DNA helicase-2/ATP-dependent DNA helicase PcrA
MGTSLRTNEAEFHTVDGPALLLAGPGTGKTYQLALRVKFLVEQKQVAPEQIPHSATSISNPAA